MMPLGLRYEDLCVAIANVRKWRNAHLPWWAEHVFYPQVLQTLSCLAIARASSASMPR